MELTEILTEFIIETSENGLPEEILEKGKQIFLDCLGGAIAGSKDEGAKIVHEYIRSIKASGPCTVLGTDLRVFPEHAALANGTAAHALDIDDTNSSMNGHPSVAILPVSLALSEWVGCNGKRMISSFIVGFEVEAKMGRLINPDHTAAGWHTAGTLGTLGATASACYLLDLSKKQTCMAMGISASLASGIAANFGSMVKPFHAGHAARNGIVAASLAQKGFTSQINAFSGKMDFLRAFANKETPYENYDSIKQALGNPFDIVEPGTDIKLYPSCNLTHTAVDTILYLVEAHPDISPESIEQIECRFIQQPQYFLEYLPRTGTEGRFSLEFLMALVVLEKEVWIDHFTDEMVTNPKITSLMNKVRLLVDPELRQGGGSFMFETEPAEITVQLKSGKKLNHRVNHPKGSVKNPLNTDELYHKYRRLAGRVLPTQDIEKSISLIETIEKISNIDNLTNLLRL